MLTSMTDGILSLGAMQEVDQDKGVAFSSVFKLFEFVTSCSCWLT